MITIELGHVGSKEQAEKIREILNGKSFYDFEVHYACMAHNWPVSVTTNYPDATENEVRQMLLYVLACAL